MSKKGSEDKQRLWTTAVKTSNCSYHYLNQILEVIIHHLSSELHGWCFSFLQDLAGWGNQFCLRWCAASHLHERHHYLFIGHYRPPVPHTTHTHTGDDWFLGYTPTSTFMWRWVGGVQRELTDGRWWSESLRQICLLVVIFFFHVFGWDAVWATVVVFLVFIFQGINNLD